MCISIISLWVWRRTLFSTIKILTCKIFKTRNKIGWKFSLFLRVIFIIPKNTEVNASKNLIILDFMNEKYDLTKLHTFFYKNSTFSGASRFLKFWHLEPCIILKYFKDNSFKIDPQFVETVKPEVRVTWYDFEKEKFTVISNKLHLLKKIKHHIRMVFN